MKRFFFGLLLVILGILFLLSNLQIVPYNVREMIHIYWPTLFIIWGIHEFYDEFVVNRKKSTSFGDLFFPTILTTIGIVLLGNRLDFFPNGSVNIWNVILPIGIIFLGLSLLFPSRKKKGIHDHEETFKKKVKFKNKGIHLFSSSKNTDVRNILVGSFEIGNEPWVLENSSFHVGVGEAKINLTKAYIQDGVTELDISGCTGSIVLILPADVAINVDANLDLGSITILNEEHSGTPGSVNYKSHNYDDAYKKLDIKVKLNIGEILLKQVY